MGVIHCIHDTGYSYLNGKQCQLLLKGLLDYAIKIAATWVACKKLHARIARPFTLRIQHRAIFKRVSVIGFSTAFR